jgi:hypothetical protein
MHLASSHHGQAEAELERNSGGDYQNEGYAEVEASPF